MLKKFVLMLASLPIGGCATLISAEPCGRVGTDDELWQTGVTFYAGEHSTRFSRCKYGLNRDYLDPPFPFTTDPS